MRSRNGPPSTSTHRDHLEKGMAKRPGRGALTRRQVLQGVGAGVTAFTIAPSHVLGGPARTPPSEKLNLAAVGVGGVGFGQVQACDRAGFNVVVLCDVDDMYARKAHNRWPQARRYRDFREMLEAESDKIDAVYCGTPDHTHAIISIAALKKKKHVCCVKPLTRTIQENRAVVQVARKMGVATQVTASPNTTEEGCRTCELIWAGAIGAVREAHIWSNRPLWPQGMVTPDDQDPVPSTLDWKLWIGPSAMRPFKAEWPEGHLALKQVLHGRARRAVYHPWNFRGWWEFGTGALGDMGCHHVNTPFRALKLKYPQSVHATATKVFEETAPLASIVTYDFPAREDMPPVRVVWYDGGLKPPAPKEMGGRNLPASGTLYVGDEGTMLGQTIISRSRAEKLGDVPRTLERRSGTWGEWMEACRGGQKAGCHFEWAGLITEFVLLGNIAIRTGKRLDWDAEAARFTNDRGANNHVSPPYHNGWKLEV